MHRRQYQKAVLIVPFLLVLAIVLALRAQAFPQSNPSGDLEDHELANLPGLEPGHGHVPGNSNTLMPFRNTALGSTVNPEEKVYFQENAFGHDGLGSETQGIIYGPSAALPGLHHLLIPGAIISAAHTNVNHHSDSSSDDHQPGHDYIHGDDRQPGDDHAGHDDEPAADTLSILEPTAAVPEPASLLLTGSGIIGLGVARRKKLSAGPSKLIKS